MAYTFDGVDDCLECANESTLRYEHTDAFSGHAWLRGTGTAANCIMGKAQNSPQKGWAFNFEDDAGTYSISFHLVISAPSQHVFVQAELANAPFVPGLWTPVGFTYDGSGVAAGVTLYICGKPTDIPVVTTDTLGSGSIKVDGVPFRIGGFDTEFIAASECGIVLVPAELSAADMLELADIRNLNVDPDTYLATAPDVWLPLGYNGGSGDLTDHSGNGHTASVSTGAPVVIPDPTVVVSGFSTLNFTGDNSVTLTPFGRVDAVLAGIVQNVSSSDLMTGVTHGGDALTRVPTDGLAQDAAGEPGAAYAYLKASGAQQGAQTVAFDVTSGTDAKTAFVIALNAVGNVTITDSDRVQGDTANPSVSLTTATGWGGFVGNFCYSGQNAPASLTATAGYSKLGPGRDFGSQAAVCAIGNKEGTPVTSGWTATSEDVAMIAVALTAVALVAYSLNCQPGSFAVTGTAATLAAGRVFDAQPGAYTVTGAAATVVVGRVLSADPGTYAVTGSAATVVADRVLSADPGSYAVTGAAATLAAGLVFSADPGAYTVTGADASVVPGRTVLADPGSYTVTGTDADLLFFAAGAIDAQPGTFAVTGTDATLAFTPAAAFSLDCQPGTYAVTGAAAATSLGRSISNDPGAYTVAGADTDLVHQTAGAYTINAVPGTYTVTGASASTTADRMVAATATTYALTGSSATLFGEHNIAATAASYSVVGDAATVIATRQLSADPGTVVFSGFNASVGTIFDFDLDAELGNITVSGADANLYFEPGLARLTTRGGRIRWNTTGRITQNREGAVA